MVGAVRCLGAWSRRRSWVALLALAPACALTERNPEPPASVAGAGESTDEPGGVDDVSSGVKDVSSGVKDVSSGSGAMPSVDADEPGPPCAPQTLFASQQPLEGLAPPGAHAERAWLSADERRVYFIAVFPDARAVWQAARASRRVAFEAAVPMPAPTSPGLFDLAMSADGRTLLGEERALGQHRIVQLSPTARGSDVGRVVVADAAEPWLSADAQRLYFIRNFGTLMVATLTNSGVFGSERDVFGSGAFGASADGRGGTVLSRDELSLYYSEPFEGQTDIYLAQRQSRDDSFAYAGAFGSLNSDQANETPDWLSPDGCRLYFERGTQLFMATK